MIGKIVAGLIGFFSFGPLGAIVGIGLGHFFDVGRAQLEQSFSPEQRAAVEHAFFHSIFPLLGYLAKADGRVSEQEIAGTEQVMAKMGLGTEARAKAISLFKEGVDSSFNPQTVLDEFITVCGRYSELKQMMLVYLISLAYADEHLHDNEERILAEVAEALGYSRFAFNQLLGMVKAQSHFYRRQQEQGSYGSTSSVDELAMAYKALGVEENATDAELKRAYRKLMSEYHPDKLAGRGVPEDMLKVATERAQEIQTAYDLVKRSRKS